MKYEVLHLVRSTDKALEALEAAAVGRQAADAGDGQRRHALAVATLVHVLPHRRHLHRSRLPPDLTQIAVVSTAITTADTAAAAAAAAATAAAAAANTLTALYATRVEQSRPRDAGRSLRLKRRRFREQARGARRERLVGSAHLHGLPERHHDVAARVDFESNL